MKKFFLLPLFVLAGLHGFLLGQNSPLKKFTEIAEAMNRHYMDAGKNAPGYKQFKRWEWYYATRTGANGTLVDNAGLNKQAYLNSSINRINNLNRTEANTGAWTPVGPTLINSTGRGIGRANRLAFHPTDISTLFLATASGGLWKTTNAGATWLPLTDGIPNLCLSGVAVHPTNPAIIYILTGDADAGGGGKDLPYGKYSSGVLKSYDGGNHWTYTGLQWSETENKMAFKLIIHPTNPEILMVPTSEGIYRTTNGGATWSNSNSGTYFWDMEFKPGDPSIVYAGGHINNTSVYLYKSTDHGQTFTNNSTIAGIWGSNSRENRIAIAVSPANPDYVYALLGPSTGEGTFQGLYRSIDEGDNFSTRTQTPNILGRSMAGDDDKHQASYDLCIAVSPTNVNRVASGGIRLWTSTNGGTTMIAHDENETIQNYYHGDLHDLIYHPLNNNLLYMIGDGGIYKSTDHGDSWNDANGTGLQITQYYRIGTDVSGVPFSENTMIGGNQDNGTNKRTGNNGIFIRLDGSDGMDCYIDPDDNTKYVWGKQDGVVLKSYNSGTASLVIATPSIMPFTAVGTWCTPVAEVAGTTNELVIGYRPVTLASDITGTFTYQPFYHSGGGAVSGRTFVRTARNNASRIYAGDNEMSNTTNFTQKVYTTTNKGANWSEIYAGINEVPFTDLTFNADNGNEMWLSFGGYDAALKVKYSNNGGSTWTNVTGSLPNVPVNCIVFDDNNGNPGGAVYIGTDIGVFYRDNNVGDWIPFSNGLPVVEVTDLEIHNAQGLLRAGTYGRGIWETSVYNNCVSTITLNTGNTTSNRPYYFQASTDIQSTAFHAGTGANVFYKAGVEMELTPGFQAIGAPGNVFKATIGPCGGGVPNRTAQRIIGVLVD